MMDGWMNEWIHPSSSSSSFHHSRWRLSTERISVWKSRRRSDHPGIASFSLRFELSSSVIAVSVSLSWHLLERSFCRYLSVYLYFVFPRICTKVSITLPLSWISVRRIFVQIWIYVCMYNAVNLCYFICLRLFHLSKWFLCFLWSKICTKINRKFNGFLLFGCHLRLGFNWICVLK